MNPLKMSASFYLWLLISAPLASAGSLKFVSNEVALGVVRNDAKITIAFRFANEGQKPVRILEVKTGCDCTSVKPQTQPYAPGAQGDLGVEFEAGGRAGPQNRTLVVTTDEEKDAVYFLSFTATVRPLFGLSSRMLSWKDADDFSSRKILLQVELAKTIAITSLEFDPAVVTATFREVVPHERFEIVVTPVRLGTRLPARIGVSVRVDGVDQKAALYAQLK